MGCNLSIQEYNQLDNQEKVVFRVMHYKTKAQCERVVRWCTFTGFGNTFPVMEPPSVERERQAKEDAWNAEIQAERDAIAADEAEIAKLPIQERMQAAGFVSNRKMQLESKIQMKEAKEQQSSFFKPAPKADTRRIEIKRPYTGHFESLLKHVEATQEKGKEVEKWEAEENAKYYFMTNDLYSGVEIPDLETRPAKDCGVKPDTWYKDGPPSYFCMIYKSDQTAKLNKYIESCGLSWKVHAPEDMDHVMEYSFMTPGPSSAKPASPKWKYLGYFRLKVLKTNRNPWTYVIDYLAEEGLTPKAVMLHEIPAAQGCMYHVLLDL